ncbi:hypothetical protein B6U91_01805 [Candidatus Pacearchaeota archaeon ex4484_71]|nr:MAG: hypothetical protein B6U91_01805 [Candidatus Pacearchaeota archaeon ex4484_71]
MKKFVYLFLSIFLISLVLSSCGTKPKYKGPNFSESKPVAFSEDQINSALSLFSLLLVVFEDQITNQGYYGDEEIGVFFELLEVTDDPIVVLVYMGTLDRMGCFYLRGLCIMKEDVLISKLEDMEMASLLLMNIQSIMDRESLIYKRYVPLLKNKLKEEKTREERVKGKEVSF